MRPIPTIRVPTCTGNGSGRPYRVLVTDADFKHSIALARHIRKELPGVHLTGHAAGGVRYAKYYGVFDGFVTQEQLRETLLTRDFDQVIPVGCSSVLTVAATRPELAVLAPMETLISCFDKRLTVELANRVGVPAPRTQALTSLAQLDVGQLSLPCVVRPAHENVTAKRVHYCSNLAEARHSIGIKLKELERDGVGVLVQDYIDGPGHGFFALLDRGKPLRVFMHKRLREDPPQGGPSTAAASFYSSRLEELGLRLLSSLQWHGAAMVEFKYDIRRQDFVLMEINGKMWGSTELALQAGVNFGADLIRLYRGEPMQYSSAYDRKLQFYWPLDGDLKTLWTTRRVFSGVGDYLRAGAVTNCGQSLRAEAVKTLRLLRDIMHAERP